MTVVYSKSNKVSFSAVIEIYHKTLFFKNLKMVVVHVLFHECTKVENELENEVFSPIKLNR